MAGYDKMMGLKSLWWMVKDFAKDIFCIGATMALLLLLITVLFSAGCKDSEPTTCQAPTSDELVIVCEVCSQGIVPYEPPYVKEVFTGFCAAVANRVEGHFPAQWVQNNCGWLVKDFLKKRGRRFLE